MNYDKKDVANKLECSSESSKSNDFSADSNTVFYACPHCGSTLVHKSIGGKLEHAVAWGTTKAIKSTVLGGYGRLTLGIENEIVKQEVPFQQVCDYCHRTFHARKSQIDKGVYSMRTSEANKLMKTYNKKLQIIKDQEVEEIRKQAEKELRKTFFSGIVFIVGLIMSMSVERETVGIFGLPETTFSYLFSCILMVGAAGYALIKGLNCKKSYTEASELENLPIEEYAKTHQA